MEPEEYRNVKKYRQSLQLEKKDDYKPRELGDGRVRDEMERNVDLYLNFEDIFQEEMRRENTPRIATRWTPAYSSPGFPVTDINNDVIISETGDYFQLPTVKQRGYLLHF